MELLQAGVDSIETTQTYLHAHLALKETASAKLKSLRQGTGNSILPHDRLLEFLNAL
jgi:integrase/recombinase XerD